MLRQLPSFLLLSLLFSCASTIMRVDETVGISKELPKEVATRFEVKEVIPEPAAPKVKQPTKKQSRKTVFTIPQRRLEKMPFEVGEVMKFEITFLGMAAGEFKSIVRPHKMMNGRKVQSFFATAQSSSVFNLFYKLDDRFESFWDYDGMFSYRFHMLLNQSRQSRDSLELFDSEKKEVHYWSRKNHIEKGFSEVKETKPIGPFPQDSISSMYYLRTLPYEVGKTYTFPMVAEGKNWEALVTVIRKETIDTAIGKKEAFVLKPETKFQGVMSQSRGDSFIWISDDDKRYVLRIEAKVKVGTVVAHLKAVGNE